MERRSAIAARYRGQLGDLPGLTLPQAVEGHSWNQFVVCIDGNRDAFKQTLQDRGVNTIIYYPIPIHSQPAYSQLGLEEGSLPITENLCRQVLSLPIFPELTDAQQQTVITTLQQLLRMSDPTPLPRSGDQERMVA